jgi:trehalose 6-phosphate phosphatase
MSCPRSIFYRVVIKAAGLRAARATAKSERRGHKGETMLPKIEDVGRYAVFLDLDGTLTELVDYPDGARLDRSTLRLIETLSERVGGAVAVVSGRAISVVDVLLHPLVLPVAGVHGLERRDARGLVHSKRSTDISPITFVLEKTVGDETGVIIERKPGAVALHYRLRPDLEQRCCDIVHDVIGKHPNLRLLHGKMVFELMPRGGDKGSVIEAFLSEPPFLGRKPLFAGDDVTDEAGFSVVNARGGVSIKIGDGESLARYRADDIRQFHDWLEGLVDNCHEEQIH